MNGAPAKPMSGVCAGQRRAQTADRREDLGGVLLRRRQMERVDRRRRPQRLREDRRGMELETEAETVERRQDVAEQDRRVESETSHRLQGHFDRELRRPHHGQEVVLGAQRPVLGEVAPGLAHDPDRGVRGTAAGALQAARKVAA